MPQCPLGHRSQRGWTDPRRLRQHGQPDRQHRQPYPLHRQHRRNCQNRHPVLGKRPPSGAPIDLNGDGEITFLDTYIYLFRDDGSLDSSDYIAHNDDSDHTYGDGSIWSTDSYLEQNLAAGNYLLAIGAYALGLNEAMQRENQDTFYPLRCDITSTDCLQSATASEHGAYRVNFSQNVSVSGKIPEPAPLGLLGLGLAGIAGFALRGRRKP